MSEAHAARLAQTGMIPATGETFMSPSQAFAEGYDGVLVELQFSPGTTSLLESMGVRDDSALTAAAHPDMPAVSSGWSANSAYFKGEDGIINIGLGRGAALAAANKNLVGYVVRQ
jgi:filamentous hemagglutinin